MQWRILRFSTCVLVILIMGSCDSIPQQPSPEEIEEARLEEYCCEVLGIDRNATEQEIKRAYRNLARSYRPDKNSYGKSESEKKLSQEKFCKINWACKTLIALREAGARTQRDLVSDAQPEVQVETLHSSQKRAKKKKKLALPEP